MELGGMGYGEMKQVHGQNVGHCRLGASCPFPHSFISGIRSGSCGDGT